MARPRSRLVVGFRRMPIPVAKIKEELRPLEERIYGVLASDPENAYGLEELYTAVAGRKPSEAAAGMSESERRQHLDEWARALLALEDHGRIERVERGG